MCRRVPDVNGTLELVGQRGSPRAVALDYRDFVAAFKQRPRQIDPDLSAAGDQDIARFIVCIISRPGAYRRRRGIYLARPRWFVDRIYYHLNRTQRRADDSQLRIFLRGFGVAG